MPEKCSWKGGHGGNASRSYSFQGREIPATSRGMRITHETTRFMPQKASKSIFLRRFSPAGRLRGKTIAEFSPFGRIPGQEEAVESDTPFQRGLLWMRPSAPWKDEPEAVGPFEEGDAGRTSSEFRTLNSTDLRIRMPAGGGHS